MSKKSNFLRAGVRSTKIVFLGLLVLEISYLLKA